MALMLPIVLLDICAELNAHLFDIPPVLIQDNPERLKDRAQQAFRGTRRPALRAGKSSSAGQSRCLDQARARRGKHPRRAGPGTLDFAPGFRALKQLWYQDLIEVECRSLSGPGEIVLPRSVAYFQRVWQEA